MLARAALALLAVLVATLPAAAEETPAVFCRGRKATIVGTDGDDVLIGTPGPDVIAALGGADSVRARGGDDLVCGGAGDDLLKGGAGDDVLAGGGGDDRITGGGGDDELWGGAGADWVGGWTGADRLAGGTGPDALDGGEGADLIDAGGGEDRCRRGVGYQGCEKIRRAVRVLPPGSYGLPTATRSYHAVVADFDADGRADVMVSHHASRKYYPEVPADGIYYNRVGSLDKEVAFPLADRHGCDAGDVDGDGRIDLYCQIGGASGNATDKTDELWMQQPDGSFIDGFPGSGVSDPVGRGRFPALFDADGDGDLDLLLTNGHRPGPGSVSALWINEGGVFVPGEEWGLDGYDASKPRVDARDGWVLVADDGRARLFRRSGDRYEEVGSAIGADEWSTLHGLLVDFDDDGLLDAVVAHSRGIAIRPLEPLLSQGIDVPVSSTKAVAVGDFDGDGRNDAYVVRSGTGCGSPDTAANRDDFILFGPDLSRRERIPMRDGCGAYAVPLDLDGDGNDEILVLNGQQLARGPLSIVDVE